MTFWVGGEACTCDVPLTDEDVAAYGGEVEDDDEPFCWRCKRPIVERPQEWTSPKEDD